MKAQDQMSAAAIEWQLANQSSPESHSIKMRNLDDLSLLIILKAYLKCTTYSLSFYKTEKMQILSMATKNDQTFPLS